MMYRLRRYDVAPYGRIDAMFAYVPQAHIVPYAHIIVAGNIIRRSDIICPTGQTSLKKAIAFAIVFFVVNHRRLELRTP